MSKSESAIDIGLERGSFRAKLAALGLAIGLLVTSACTQEEDHCPCPIPPSTPPSTPEKPYVSPYTTPDKEIIDDYPVDEIPIVTDESDASLLEPNRELPSLDADLMK